MKDWNAVVTVDEAGLLGDYVEEQLRSQDAAGKVTFNDPM